MRPPAVQTASQRHSSSIERGYYDFVERDHSKIFVQFPWALRQVGRDLSGLRALDVGCGQGALSRLLAEGGARVCGYDPSVFAIDLARAAEAKEPLGIEYFVARPRDVEAKILPRQFDAALAVLVLHYAESDEELRMFFSSTFALLRPGGLFAALVPNPRFKRWGMQAYNRRYVRMPGRQVRAEFFEGTAYRCSAFYTDFSTADYEAAASATGWPHLDWVPVGVAAQGRSALGAFWDGFDEDCPYAGFRTWKPSDVGPSA